MIRPLMHRLPIRLAAACSLMLLGSFAVSLHAEDGAYVQHNLVSDGSVTADHTDPNLVNPWGIAFNPNAFVWIADNGSGFSTLYDGHGTSQPLVVQIPSPPGSTDPGNPTGIVFNTTTDFPTTTSRPAVFLFATESGLIAGWNPAVDTTHALLLVDRSTSHSIYKGLAIGGDGTGHFLFATDFHNGKVDIFDKNLQRVDKPDAFVDPMLPSGFAPFGIQNIGGDLFVTFAKQDADAHDDVHGRGLGFVDIFNTTGTLVRRFAQRGLLNAPWGLALAPADFGRFSNDLLVGNFGDGAINAFDLSSGFFMGQLRASSGRTLHIDGLWGLAFGNGVDNQRTNTLFFTAGPNDEANGLYGRLDPASRHNDRDDGDHDGDDNRGNDHGNGRDNGRGRALGRQIDPGRRF